MKQLSKIFVFLLAVLGLVALVSCGGGDTNTPEPKQEEKKKKNDKNKPNKPTKTTKTKKETPVEEPTPAVEIQAVDPVVSTTVTSAPTEQPSVDQTIEDKKKILADAKPVEITNTPTPENDVMLEKTVLMPRILLEEENKETTVAAPVVEPTPVVAPTMEPLPTAPVVETNPNKPQKVTEEEFLFDSSEVQTNPFEIKEDGVK